MIDELCDRFGEPPASVMGLIDVALLRSSAAAAGITEITENAHAAVLHISSIRPQVAARLSGAFGARFILNAKEKPTYIIRLQKGQTQAELASELMQTLYNE